MVQRFSNNDGVYFPRSCAAACTSTVVGGASDHLLGCLPMASILLSTVSLCIFTIRIFPIGGSEERGEDGARGGGSQFSGIASLIQPDPFDG